jgi:hypothetical protein
MRNPLCLLLTALVARGEGFGAERVVQSIHNIMLPDKMAMVLPTDNGTGRKALQRRQPLDA